MLQAELAVKYRPVPAVISTDKINLGGWEVDRFCHSTDGLKFFKKKLQNGWIVQSCRLLITFLLGGNSETQKWLILKIDA